MWPHCHVVELIARISNALDSALENAENRTNVHVGSRWLVEVAPYYTNADVSLVFQNGSDTVVAPRSELVP